MEPPEPDLLSEVLFLEDQAKLGSTGLYPRMDPEIIL